MASKELAPLEEALTDAVMAASLPGIHRAIQAGADPARIPANHIIGAIMLMHNTTLRMADTDEFDSRSGTVVRLLAEHGFITKASADDLVTALQVDACSPAVIRALIEAGGDVNARDEQGSTALHQVWRLDTECELINAGADIEARDSRGHTPLHRSFGHDEPDLAMALINAGADVTVRDNKGWTPIRWLVIGRRGLQVWEITELLTTMLELGADATVADNEGQTPLGALRADPDPAYSARDAKLADMLSMEEAWHRRRHMLLAVLERYAAMDDEDADEDDLAGAQALGQREGVGGDGTGRMVVIVYFGGMQPPASTA